MQPLRTLSAFFMRDLATELSYKIAFVLSFSSVIFNAVFFFFLSNLFDGQNNEWLQEYGGNYFGYVVIGMALVGYFTVGLQAFSQALRTAQTTGTLEAMMMTPTPISLVIIGSAMWNYANTTFRVIAYLGLGALLGMSFANANWLGGLLILILSIVAFASIGIIAASIIMVIKRGNPITLLFGNLAALTGGVYFPVESLPDWLQPVGYMIPITYALDGMRDALLKDAPLQLLLPNLMVLGIFCLVLVPLSLTIFHYAVEWARRDGSLAHY